MYKIYRDHNHKGNNMYKLIKRLLLALLATFAIIIIFLVASVAIDAALGGDRLQAVTNTNIPGSGDQPAVRAYVARPSGSGPYPAVILIHEFFGLNENITSLADGLAEAGYLAVAPDTFRGSTTNWIPRAIYQVITTDSEQVNADLHSVFTWLEAQPDVDPDRIAVLGFCYGGRASLTYSLHNRDVAATLVFYGFPVTDPEVLRTLPGPVLGIFGGSDRSIPLREVQAFEAGLNEAGIPNEITVYEGQPHAFITNMEAVRAGGAQGEAWAQMVAFLDRNLKGAGASHLPGAETDGISTYTAPFAWVYYARLVYEHTLGAASQQH
jgi:carboxymethylenebutenolidase